MKIVVSVACLVGLVYLRAGSAGATTPAAGDAAAPAKPSLHWTVVRDAPPRIRGFVQTSPNVHVTMTFNVVTEFLNRRGNAMVRHQHRVVRSGTTGPRGRFWFKLRFRFQISHPTYVGATVVARVPHTGESSESLVPPLAAFPPVD